MSHLNNINNKMSMDTQNAAPNATIFSYVVSLIMMFAGLTLEQWIGIGGFVLMLATFAVNAHYRRRDEQRANERHSWDRERHRAEMTSRGRLHK